MGNEKRMDNQNVQEILSLLPLQEGLMYHYLENPVNQTYFEQLSLHLQGRFDLHALRTAWNSVMEANEMLRTVFRWEKLQKPVQIVLKWKELPIRVHDLSPMNEEDQTQMVLDIKENDQREQLDLREEPFRITVILLNDNEFVMMLSYHHILFDGWSLGVVLKELFEAYQAACQGLRLEWKKKNSFKDYVKWIQNQNLVVQKQYWQSYLAGFDNITSVPALRENPGVGSGEVSIGLGVDLTHHMEQFVRDERITLAAVLFTVWGVLLQIYNNTDDAVFGTTVSGRNASFADLETMVGLFINTIPLRVKAAGDTTIRTLLQDVDRVLKERIEYEHVPLVEIQSHRHEQLFDSIVVIENYPFDKMLNAENPFLRVQSYSMAESTHYDLTLVVKTDEEIHLKSSTTVYRTISRGGASRTSGTI